MNCESISAESYYRKSLFIPFIDHFVWQFTKHKYLHSIFQNFIPNKLLKLSENEIVASIRWCVKQWPIHFIKFCDNVFNKKALLWKQKRVTEDKLSCTFIDGIHFCFELLSPKVYQSLKMCVLLPVIVVSIKRSFSELKSLKSYLRNSTGKYRLNVELSVNREIPIKVLR